MMLAAICSLALLPVGDWPQFLGPDRTGVSAETGLAEAFPAAGPKVAWRVPGGVGMTGVVVAGGKAILLLHAEGKQEARCLDAATGKTVWRTPLAPAYKNGQGDGPRGTPTIHDGLVFVHTGEGILAALQLADGKEAWRRHPVVDHGGQPAEYGMACSPLVAGNLVVVACGAPNAALAAYDCKTGKPAWTAGDGDHGYSSPALLQVAGRKQIVAATGSGILGVDPASGRALWRHPFKTDYGCNTATPLAIDEKVLITAGENHGSVLLAFAQRGDGFDTHPAWESLGPKSVLRSEWQTPALLGGKLYGMDNAGSAGPVTHLTCVDPATGKALWQKPRFGKGNFTAADGKLFVIGFDGQLAIVAAQPAGFRELARAPLMAQTRTAPALANGYLYLRDDKEIVCVDVRK